MGIWLTSLPSQSDIGRICDWQVAALLPTARDRWGRQRSHSGVGPHRGTLRPHHPGVRPRRRRSRRPGILIRRWWSCTRWRRAMPFASWCSSSQLLGAPPRRSLVNVFPCWQSWSLSEWVSPSSSTKSQSSLTQVGFFGHECFVCEGAID